jgi:methylated-DNA-[protein]-cysteine S-methyltransferase
VTLDFAIPLGGAQRYPPAVIRFALFETAIGRCGVAWSEVGLVRTQLPEADDDATRARLTKSLAAVVEARPTGFAAKAIASVTRHLRGEASDLAALPLDMTGVPDFYREVYEASRSIPSGATMSYGELAKSIGKPGAARAVGQAMGKNPFAPIVPCHRVLAAGKRAGGFSAHGGIATKTKMLAIEGFALEPAPQLGLFAGAAKLAFDTDAAVAHLRASDRKLAAAIDTVGPCALKLDRAETTFAALAQSIAYQQLTGKAAATIFARVGAACRPFTPEQMLRTSDAALRGAGLSGSKLLALKDLARKSIDGTVPHLDDLHTLSDDAIVERLTAVRGIGRWTVEMLLIFRLGRPDVLPIDDYGVRKGFAKVYRKRELPKPKDLEKFGERWRPYRSVASWYLWRVLDTVGGRA